MASSGFQTESHSDGGDGTPQPRPKVPIRRVLMYASGAGAILSLPGGIWIFGAVLAPFVVPLLLILPLLMIQAPLLFLVRQWQRQEMSQEIAAAQWREPHRSKGVMKN